MSYTRWHDSLRRRRAAERAGAIAAPWLRELDAGGDRLLAAQAALRLPAAERPAPPAREPVRPTTAAERWARPAPPKGPRPESLVAPEGQRLLGAYARRAAAQGSQ